MGVKQADDLTHVRARVLRRSMTDVERSMWRLLRDRRLLQMKWRRQVPIGRFIVDFLCFDHRLIVECDGSQHSDNAHDGARDAWLRSQGFAICRFWNVDVIQQRTAVIDTILQTCGLSD